MNRDYVDKNVDYQYAVGEIAKYLFHVYYYDMEESAQCTNDPNQYEREGVNDLLPKAEKIYAFFGNHHEAKRVWKFLNVVNPIKAREILDTM